MQRRFVSGFAFAALLAAAACNVQLTAFTVPTMIWTGSTFLVQISAAISGDFGGAGCVLQLPNGFTVAGFACSMSEPVAMDPALSAIYTPEPGHHLIAFSGSAHEQSAHAANAVLQVHVRAALGLSGPYTFKVALAGNNGGMLAQDPPVTQFAAITATPYVRTSMLVTEPVTDFAIDAAGLPIGSGADNHWTAGVCGDLDGDGNDDIVAFHVGQGIRHFQALQPVVSALGTFWTERAGASIGSLVVARAAIADLDGDGQLDVMLGTGQPIFGNAGQWTLGAVPPLRPGTADSVAIGDVDEDGLPDIALGGRTSTTLQVLLNNGNRTFRDASAGLPGLPGATARDEVLFADLDGDGHLDLFWSTRVGTFAWLGDGRGRWTATTMPSFQHEGDAVAIDIDGDGAIEIVTARGVVLRYAGGNAFALVPNTGLDAPAFAGAVVAALDFDRDGDVDLAVAHTGISLWHNDGTGHFALAGSSGPPNNIPGSVADLAVGDFDGNSWPDLVVTVDGTGVFALQNRRTGVAPFAAGCGAAGVQTPELKAIGTPTLGNAGFALELHCNVGSVLGGFWFAADRRLAGTVPLPGDLTPLGAPGCALLVAPTFLHLGMLDANGNLVVPLPVPANPLLSMRTVFGQACACVPNANPAGAVLSAGVAIRFD